ncbi:Hypothetical predicted protein [Olea europaea subsp. europaea]|uniref:Uncharacterized protein n=1 Tax=Olea europaea subsp. europaea TaxID=158383 RepID=A0A8S0RE98_OLEEU|nr:Hypothetical predicted protein [Olea europaea subsp. europaea]
MCGRLPDDAVMDRVLQKKRLKDKYFKSTERISCGELEKAFLRPSTPRADQYKLELALIIEGVFNAPDSHAGIELPTLSIVDNLDILGRKFVDATNKKEKAITYTVHGFPIAMQIWAFEAIPEIGDRFARRLGHQSPRLLSWTCTKQPQHRTYDVFFKNIKLHVFATLRPTEAELGQPCISTLLSFEDRTVPVLDEVTRDIIPTRLHPDPLPSGGNVGNSRGSAQWFPVEEAPRTIMNRGTVRMREPVRRPEVIRVEIAMERPRTRGTVGTVRMTTLVHRRLGHIPLPPCTDVLLPFMHPPHLMYDKVKPLV